MRNAIRNVIFAAVAGAAPLLAGCVTGYQDDPSPSVQYRPSAYDRPAVLAAGQTPSAQTQPQAGPTQTDPNAQGGNGQAEGAPAADTTGIRYAELPAIKQAITSAKPWQEAEQQLAQKIDAPDLRQNLHDGMAALAPRVARGLVDFRGDIAIVTVAVYRDARGEQPAPQPGTQAANATPTTNPLAIGAAPATQPVYKDVAIALAFEGFGQRLDGSFLPRVLADQPRAPQDGREQMDPNLVLDKDATSYIVYQLTRDGLVAGVIGHNPMRQQLADAAAALPPPNARAQNETQPQQPQPGAPSTEIAPVPSVAGGGYFDNGAPRANYGGYYGGPSYGGPSYVYDPYVSDLYDWQWGSGYYISGRGWYGGGPWYYDRDHGWHHRHDDHVGPGNVGRPTAAGTRGQAPWLRPPVVSRTNPTGSIGALSPGNRSATVRGSARDGTPLDIPAASGGSANISSAADGRLNYQSHGRNLTYIPRDRNIDGTPSNANANAVSSSDPRILSLPANNGSGRTFVPTDRGGDAQPDRTASFDSSRQPANSGGSSNIGSSRGGYFGGGGFYGPRGANSAPGMDGPAWRGNNSPSRGDSSPARSDNSGGRSSAADSGSGRGGGGGGGDNGGGGGGGRGSSSGGGGGGGHSGGGGGGGGHR